MDAPPAHSLSPNARPPSRAVRVVEVDLGESELERYSEPQSDETVHLTAVQSPPPEPAFQPESAQSLSERFEQTSPKKKSAVPSNVGDSLTVFGAPALPRPAAALTNRERWLAVLRAPREFFIVLLIKFLLSYAYFSSMLVLVLWLTDEIGLSDISAGWTYGVYGMATTVWGLVGGAAIDWMGVKLSLIVGSFLVTASRIFLTLSTTRASAIFLLLTSLPLGESLGIPVLSVAVKRYTNQSNKQLGYSLFYSFMNIAALLAGLFTDAIRSAVSKLNPSGNKLVLFGVQLVFHRVVFLTGALSTLICFFISLGLREVEIDDRGRERNFAPNRDNPMHELRRVVREPSFWRLCTLTLLLIGVRLIFRHLDATLPKYMVRVFGPSAPFGSFYALEPLIVVFAVPLAGSLLHFGGSFPLIVIGSFIAGASPFWLCLGNKYVFIVLFIVTLSLGESVYSPRVYEYTMDIAGRGSEGLYAAMVSAPLFAVKLIAGGMSGWLLHKYVPAHGERHPQIMWAIIGLTSIASPILMTVFRRCIEDPDAAIEATAALASGGYEMVELESGVDRERLHSREENSQRSESLEF